MCVLVSSEITRPLNCTHSVFKYMLLVQHLNHEPPLPYINAHTHTRCVLTHFIEVGYGSLTYRKLTSVIQIYTVNCRKTHTNKLKHTHTLQVVTAVTITIKETTTELKGLQDRMEETEGQT